MIKLNIKHTKINASCLETLVEGNVNSVFAEFTFSPEWDNLSRVAIFSNGTSKISVALSENTCAIPWEMLSCPGELIVAVRGIGDGGNLVLCTENASLGKVIESLADDDADEPEEASPDVIDALLADVAELKSSVIAGEGGHTPVKGTDYWTDEDKAEIVDDVLDEIPEIPTQLSQLTGDSTHRVVTDTEKAAWNGKQDTIDASHKLPYTYLSGTPTIPTVPTDVSAFTNDANYLTLATLPIYNGGVS